MFPSQVLHSEKNALFFYISFIYTKYTYTLYPSLAINLFFLRFSLPFQLLIYWIIFPFLCVFKACRSSIIEMINRQCDKINMFNFHQYSGGGGRRMVDHPNCCGGSASSSGGCRHHGVSQTLGKTYLVSINRCKTGGGATHHKQAYLGQGKVETSSRKITSTMNAEQSRHSTLHNGSTTGKKSWTAMQELYPAGTEGLKYIYVQNAKRKRVCWKKQNVSSLVKNKKATWIPLIHSIFFASLIIIYAIKTT